MKNMSSTQNGDGQHHNDGGTSTISVQINTDYQNAHRFPVWMGLTVFSVVCLVALQSRKSLFDPDGAGEAWVLSVCCISFILSLAATSAYLCFRSIFVGQVWEIGMATLLLAFWSAGLPTIMNPGNDIAVAKPTSSGIAPVVTNANLYFGAWVSFACIIYIAGSLIQETIGVDVTATPAKTSRWFGLATTSMIVLGSSVRAFTTSDCGVDDDSDGVQYCKRTSFAISLGVIGFFLAVTMTYNVAKQIFLFSIFAEMIITLLQLILWCLGVSFITFGKAPGATIGNLFFSTWISFIIAVFLFSQSFRDYVGATENVASQQQHGSSPDHEITDTNQDFDDAI